MSDILQAIERKAEELNFSKALFINSGSGIPFSQSRDYYFPEGIIGTRGNFPPFLHVVVAERWEAIQDLQCKYTLRAEHDTEHGSVITTGYTRYRATFRGGSTHRFVIGEDSERTLASDYFRYGIRSDVIQQIRDAATTRRTISTAVANAQLPQILQRIQAGDRVMFGALSADHEGIYTTDNAFFPWHALSVAEVSPDVSHALRGHSQVVLENTLCIKEAADPRPHKFPVSSIHNFGAFHLLCAYIKARS
jgi:hypothetical protein